MDSRERKIAFDTETTGMVKEKDRIIEIGAVEMIGNVITGRTFHQYINPGRVEVHKEAFAVHGLSNEFLADKPYFRAVIDDFLAFIGDSTLVIHNASFDMGFINEELKRNSRPALTNRVEDTLTQARKRYPGQQVSLDALCRKLNVDNAGRALHGALLDSDLLAQVYIKMHGLDRLDLSISEEFTTLEPEIVAASPQEAIALNTTGFIAYASAKEKEIHAGFLAKALKNSVWENLGKVC